MTFRFIAFFWGLVFSFEQARASFIQRYFECAKNLIAPSKPLVENRDRFARGKDMRLFIKESRLMAGRSVFRILKEYKKYLLIEVPVDFLVLERSEMEAALYRLWESFPKIETVVFEQRLYPGAFVYIDEIEKLYFYLRKTQKRSIVLKINRHADGAFYLGDPFNFIKARLYSEDWKKALQAEEQINALAEKNGLYEMHTDFWSLYRKTLNAVKMEEWAIPYYQERFCLFLNPQEVLSLYQVGTLPSWAPDLEY